MINTSLLIQKYHSYYQTAKEQVSKKKGEAINWAFSNINPIKYGAASIILIILLAVIAITQWPHPDKPQVLGITTASDYNVSNPSPQPTASQEASKIKVDVSGAVNNPGLIELNSGDRINDALKAAGGYNSDADINYLAQALNLAQKLNDGDKLYIPSKNESVTFTTIQNPPSTSVSIYQPSSTSSPVIQPSTSVTKAATTSPTARATTPAPTVSGPISLNEATQAELESLPGIGPSYAQKIIAHRPYATIDQVCVTGVVGTGSLCQKIKPLITL